MRDFFGRCGWRPPPGSFRARPYFRRYRRRGCGCGGCLLPLIMIILVIAAILWNL